MREHEIRRALLDELKAVHTDDTLIVEEMGLDQGSIRVDVAVVNETLSGFEIKSDWDTLERLPAQRDTYNCVFDQVTVVTGSRHLDHVRPLIPDWWGITVADRGVPGSLRVEREPGSNPSRDPELLARLLWRNEALALLTRLGETRLDRAPRRVLWARLLECLPVDQLANEVRRAIKGRTGWSTVRPRS